MLTEKRRQSSPAPGIPQKYQNQIRLNMIRKILLAPLIFLEAMTDRVVSIIGAIVFMQIPAFMVQYKQRLGGHVDELARVIGQYESAATEHGRVVENYIELHLNSDTNEFISTGKLMTDNVERFHELSLSLQNLSEAAKTNKLFVFLRDIDLDIFKGTLRDFVPSISFNLDSILYCIVGLVISMSLYFLICKTLHLLIIRDKKK